MACGVESQISWTVKSFQNVNRKRARCRWSIGVFRFIEKPSSMPNARERIIARDWPCQRNVFSYPTDSHASAGPCAPRVCSNRCVCSPYPVLTHCTTSASYGGRESSRCFDLVLPGSPSRSHAPIPSMEEDLLRRRPGDACAQPSALEPVDGWAFRFQWKKSAAIARNTKQARRRHIFERKKLLKHRTQNAQKCLVWSESNGFPIL